MKRILKFATGQPLPEGAVYLNTVTQTKIETTNNGNIPCICHGDPRCSSAPKSGWVDCYFVWHYFLVEEEKK